ncbi:MAG: hypothetical protein R2792_06410 [Saprospiraceae bacterium]
MNFYISALIRTAFTVVAFLVAQYMIPYYFLVAGGLIAGVFLWKTGTDKALAVGLLAGSILYGIFAYLYGNV